MPRMYDEKKPAVRVMSFYKDFDGEVSKWKESFYTLWRYQLTWSLAYRIDIFETRSSGVYVCILLKPEYLDTFTETMEDLGYRNIRTENTNIGEVWAYEHDELDNVEALVLEY